MVYFERALKLEGGFDDDMLDNSWNSFGNKLFLLKGYFEKALTLQSSYEREERLR